MKPQIYLAAVKLRVTADPRTDELKERYEHIERRMKTARDWLLRPKPANVVRLKKEGI